MVVLKLLIICCCVLMAFQDLKERAITALLFPVLALLLIILHLNHSSETVFLINIIANVVLVTSVISILFLYTKYLSKKAFLNHSFGLGDLLFFYCFSLGFPTITFATLFVASVFFSLLVFFILGKNLSAQTVPLAGLMGIFLSGIMALSFLSELPSLYLI